MKPAIPLGSKFWALSQIRTERDRRAIPDAGAASSGDVVEVARRRSQVEVVDAAYWMKGCSSSACLRFAGAAHGRLRQEARHGADGYQGGRHRGGAALPAEEMPKDQAERVVEGAIEPVAASRQANGGRQDRSEIGVRPRVDCRRISRSKSNVDGARRDEGGELSWPASSAKPMRVRWTWRPRKSWLNELNRQRSKVTGGAVLAVVERGLAGRDPRDRLSGALQAICDAEFRLMRRSRERRNRSTCVPLAWPFRGRGA